MKNDEHKIFFIISHEGWWFLFEWEAEKKTSMSEKVNEVENFLLLAASL